MATALKSALTPQTREASSSSPTRSLTRLNTRELVELLTLNKHRSAKAIAPKLTALTPTWAIRTQWRALEAISLQMLDFLKVCPTRRLIKGIRVTSSTARIQQVLTVKKCRAHWWRLRRNWVVVGRTQYQATQTQRACGSDSSTLRKKQSQMLAASPTTNRNTCFRCRTKFSRCARIQDTQAHLTCLNYNLTQQNFSLRMKTMKLGRIGTQLKRMMLMTLWCIKMKIIFDPTKII